MIKLPDAWSWHHRRMEGHPAASIMFISWLVAIESLQYMMGRRFDPPQSFASAYSIHQFLHEEASMEYCKGMTPPKALFEAVIETFEAERSYKLKSQSGLPPAPEGDEQERPSVRAIGGMHSHMGASCRGSPGPPRHRSDPNPQPRPDFWSLRTAGRHCTRRTSAATPLRLG